MGESILRQVVTKKNAQCLAEQDFKEGDLALIYQNHFEITDAVTVTAVYSNGVFSHPSQNIAFVGSNATSINRLDAYHCVDGELNHLGELVGGATVGIFREMAFHPDGNLFVAVWSNIIKVYGLSGLNITHLYDIDIPLALLDVFSCSFSANGDKLVIGGRAGGTSLISNPFFHRFYTVSGTNIEFAKHFTGNDNRVGCWHRFSPINNNMLLTYYTLSQPPKKYLIGDITDENFELGDGSIFIVNEFVENRLIDFFFSPDGNRLLVVGEFTDSNGVFYSCPYYTIDGETLTLEGSLNKGDSTLPYISRHITGVNYTFFNDGKSMIATDGLHDPLDLQTMHMFNIDETGINHVSPINVYTTLDYHDSYVRRVVALPDNKHFLCFGYFGDPVKLCRIEENYARPYILRVASGASIPKKYVKIGVAKENISKGQRGSIRILG